MPKKTLKNPKPRKVKDVLEEFIERLAIEKGITGMEPEVLSQIKVDLRDSLERRINAALVRNLPPSKLAAFDKMLDKGSQSKIQGFLQSNIDNMHDVIAKELLDFRRTYLIG